jgi:ABC-2 type transport system permease protein
MRAAFLIAGKDLKARIRDRSALLIGIVVPFGLAFIFNLIFGGLNGSSSVINLGVVDEDHGTLAQVFTQQVLGNVSRHGLVTVHPEASETAARDLVAKGTLSAALVIPSGFSDAVQAGQAASMHVIGNADAPISATVARSIAEGYTAELNRIRLSLETVQAGSSAPLSADQLNALATKAAATEAPLALQDVSSSTKQLDLKSFYAAGMAVFFLFFTVQFGVLGLLEERNDGTLARLLAAPIDRSSILLSKLLTSFVLGVISMTVLVLATTFLFQASWGNPVGVAILVVAAVLAATGITGLVASFARSAEEATNWQSIVALVLGLLGGAFFPVSQAQGILAKLTFVAPQAWFMRGLGDLHSGDLSVVWLPTLAMLAFAVVTGTIAVTRLRHLAEV